MNSSSFFLIGPPIKNPQQIPSFLKWYEAKKYQKQKQDRILWGWSLLTASTLLVGAVCGIIYFSTQKTIIIQDSEPPTITLDLSADLISPQSAPAQSQMMTQPEIQPLQQQEPLPFDASPAPNAEINVPKIQKIHKIEVKQTKTPQRPIQQTVKQTMSTATATNTAATTTTSASNVKSSQTVSSGHSISPANWQNQLASKLERLKHYPADAEEDKQEGTPSVRITIDRNGHVLSATLVKSSGHSLLDKEAVALIHRANPLPAPPDSIKGNTITITVPVQFYLN